MIICIFSNTGATVFLLVIILCNKLAEEISEVLIALILCVAKVLTLL